MAAPARPWIRPLLAASAIATALAPCSTHADVHPRLVSVETARCETCHGELLEGGASLHAATEDCTNCHDLRVEAGGTSVELTQDDPELCLACHDELEAAVAGDLEAPHPALADGCLGCHSPHSSDQPRLLLAAQMQVCGECHAEDDLATSHGGLLTSTTRCSGCHLPHGSDLPRLLRGSRQHPPFEDRTCDACHRPSLGGRIRLQARGQRLCLACHEDPAAIGETAGVHPALRDDARGRAACLTCHDPHLSEQSRLLVDAGPSLCARCHADVTEAARAPTGHAAADDDCANCHLPHASEWRPLLRGRATELCSECHDLEDPELEQRHLGSPLARLACIRCHTPHGAGNPSLLATHVHPPVVDACDNCHQGRFDRLEEGGGAELCLACHSEIGELADGAGVPHEAMEADSCTLCHVAHASPEPRLLRSPPESGCAECHDEKLAGADEHQHGAISRIGCHACHEPHGGSRGSLLRAEGSALCLACHGPDLASAAAAGIATAVFDRFQLSPEEAASIPSLRLSADGATDHPVTGHRALGKLTEEERRRARLRVELGEELDCLTCHDPHKGRSGQLLRWGAATPAEACRHCHSR